MRAKVVGGAGQDGAEQQWVYDFSMRRGGNVQRIKWLRMNGTAQHYCCVCFIFGTVEYHTTHGVFHDETGGVGGKISTPAGGGTRSPIRRYPSITRSKSLGVTRDCTRNLEWNEQGAFLQQGGRSCCSRTPRPSWGTYLLLYIVPPHRIHTNIIPSTVYGMVLFWCDICFFFFFFLSSGRWGKIKL